MEAALQPSSEQPEPPASPALLPSFTRKLQPQCPPPKGPPHLPLPEKGEPVLGSLTRGTLLCLELHSAAQRTERWLAEGGPAPTIPAPGVVLAWLPWHGQVCRAELGILHRPGVCCDWGSQCILAHYTNSPSFPVVVAGHGPSPGEAESPGVQRHRPLLVQALSVHVGMCV